MKFVCEIVWNDNNLAQCFLHRSRVTSLSCPLKVSMIIKYICSFGYLRLAFACFRYGNITFSKSSVDFSVFDQWLLEKVTLKSAGKSNLGRHSGVFPSQMGWIGRNFAVMLTVKVAVICLLSSIPLIGTLVAHFGLKAYFPGETCGKGVWSRFRISSFGMSCSSIINAMGLQNKFLRYVMFFNNRYNGSLDKFLLE